MADPLLAAIEIVQALRHIGTKLVCIDFDATFLDIHTGGAWNHNVSSLLPHVRPLFAALVPLLHEANIYIALVTFSPQVDMIRSLLHLCFPLFAHDVIVRGNDTTWSISHALCSDFALPSIQVQHLCISSSKLPHMISAAADIQACIQKGDTVLIDDDPNNIRNATDHGIAAIWCPRQCDPIETLCEQVKKLHVQSVPLLGTPSKVVFSQSKLQFCTPSPGTKLMMKDMHIPPKTPCKERSLGRRRHVPKEIITP